MIKEINEVEEILKKLRNELNENKVIRTKKESHIMLGKKCIIRTYSAGVHFGIVDWINPETSMEVKLTDSYRLWSWTNGGLSLSAIACNGLKGGRINKTGNIFLTNAIEYIPYCTNFEDSFKKYIED